MTTHTETVKHIVYDVGGFDPAKPNNNIVEQYDEVVVVDDETGARLRSEPGED